MPEIAWIMAPTTSLSSVTWPSISFARSRPRAPCASRSSGRDGRTHISPKSSPKSEMRLPCHYTPNQGFDAQLSAEEWRKLLFHLPLGLIKSCVEMSVREGMSHWATVMEPALLRLLTRLGIHFNPLGSLVEYHGRRQPCWVDLDVMLARVHAERPDVWEVITDGGRLWPLPEAVDTEAVAEEVTINDVIAAQAMPERRVAMR